MILAKFLRFFLLSIVFNFLSVAYALPPMNMPYGASSISREIYHLHMAAFYVCCGIGFVVFSVLIYSLIKYRKSKGAKAVHFHEHLGLEIFWTTIPFIILVCLAIPSTIVLSHIHNTDKSALTVKVTGYQWKWKYEYMDQGVSYFSNLSTPLDQINNQSPKNPWFLLEVDHPLVVPVHTKIKLLVTADDVIHAWWVPELGVKQDAIPGFVNENWLYIEKEGTYRGQCGELCGINHGFMPIVVQAVSQTEFAKWVLQQAAHQLNNNTNTMKSLKKLLPQPNISEKMLMQLGKIKYEQSCVMCHQTTGLGLPPIFPPLKKSKIVTGSPEGAIGFVYTGVPGTAMQAFGDQLDDKTMAAILTYTRAAWGNDKLVHRHKSYTAIQPNDVAKVRQAKTAA